MCVWIMDWNINSINGKFFVFVFSISKWLFLMYALSIIWCRIWEQFIDASIVYLRWMMSFLMVYNLHDVQVLARGFILLHFSFFNKQKKLLIILHTTTINWQLFLNVPSSWNKHTFEHIYRMCLKRVWTSNFSKYCAQLYGNTIAR